MSILDYFKQKDNKDKIVYGVYKEVKHDDELSPINFLLLNPFNAMEYVFPCFFLNENDAMKLRNEYTQIKEDGERYVVFSELYNNIFGNGQSLFKNEGQKLYDSYDEFIAETRSEHTL